MTDTDRMLECLERAGSHGCHSHELRRWAITGNPSQRAADLEAKGYVIERERENKGKRPGTRYKLVGVSAGHNAEPGAEQSSSATAPRGDKASVHSDESGAGGRGQAESERAQPANATPGVARPTLFDLDAPTAYDPWKDAA